jgi:hypothetical protein
MPGKALSLSFTFQPKAMRFFRKKPSKIGSTNKKGENKEIFLPFRRCKLKIKRKKMTDLAGSAGWGLGGKEPV